MESQFKILHGDIFYSAKLKEMRFRKKINWSVCFEPLVDGIEGMYHHNTDNNNVKLGKKKTYSDRVLSLDVFP